MSIIFKFEGQTHAAPESFYDTNRFTLPDGRTVAASGWLETMPPKPKGLHVVAEPATQEAPARDEPAGGDVTYIVWTAPEPDAGLPGERAEVSMFVSAEDDASVRRVLAGAFGSTWGVNARHVHVEVATEGPVDRRRLGRPPTTKPTTECARSAMLAAAHEALAALKRFEAVMVAHGEAKVGDDFAMPMSFIRGTARGAVGMIEGRLPPVERTPGTVLRAMERAYGLATVDTWRAFYQAQRSQGRAGTVEAVQAVRVAHAHGTAADFRHAFVGAELARCLEDGPDYEPTVVEPMASDYLRRLDGSTPLDAPPAEAS